MHVREGQIDYTIHSKSQNWYDPIGGHGGLPKPSSLMARNTMSNHTDMQSKYCSDCYDIHPIQSQYTRNHKRGGAASGCATSFMVSFVVAMHGVDVVELNTIFVLFVHYSFTVRSLLVHYSFVVGAAFVNYSLFRSLLINYFINTASI